jgi:hypothetical protein
VLPDADGLPIAPAHTAIIDHRSPLEESVGLMVRHRSHGDDSPSRQYDSSLLNKRGHRRQRRHAVLAHGTIHDG